MPLFLREADVGELLTTADAVAAVEESFRRLARGVVDNRPRERLRLEEGVFAVMSCLDNGVLERAAFVCCDSREDSRQESGDLIEPVAQGILDWLEVHELQEVVAGELPGRQADDDVVVFKSNGLAAWDLAVGAVAVERAPESSVGTEV